MSEVSQVIATIGFPIFSFLVTGLALKYVYDRERKSLDDTINKLTALTEAVNHNSETLSRLVSEIEERGEPNEPKSRRD